MDIALQMGNIPGGINMDLGIKGKFIMVILSLLILSNLLIGILSYNISKNQLEENGKWMLRNTVDISLELAKTLNAEVLKGNIPLDVAQEKVKVSLLGEMNANGIRPINDNIDLGDTGYFFIYNEDGLVVAHPNLEGKNVWDTETSEGFLMARDQITKALDGGGFSRYEWSLPDEQEKYGSKITYSKYYPEWGWIIVAGAYMKDFNSGANSILSSLIIILTIFTVIAAVIVFLISDKLSSGIIKAAGYADRLSHNILNISNLEYKTDDEVGILINSLNNMKNNLKESYEELEAYNEEVRSINIDLESTNRDLIKSNKRFSSLYTNMNSGFAYHKIIFGDNGEPVDYVFLEVNKAFEKLTGMKRKDVINKRVTELLLVDGDFDWIKEYGEVALTGKSKKFKQISESLNRWYNISAFSFEKGYFAVVFSDITDLMIYQEELKNQKAELLENYEKLEADNEEIIALNEELEGSYNEVNKLNQNMEQMVYLTSKINMNNFSGEDFLRDLFDTAVQLIPEAEYVILFNYKDEKIEIINSSGVGIEPGFEIGYNSDLFDNTNEQILMLNGLENKFFVKQDCLESKYKEIFNSIKETIVLNMTTHEKEKIGIAFCLVKDSRVHFSDTAYTLLKAFRELSLSFYRMQEFNVLQNNIRTDILIAVVRMLALHDTYTKNHSESVAKIAKEIAKVMELDEKLVERTYLTGLVHDIGKVLIPFDTLNKEGKLTDDEYSLIKKHPIWGYETLKAFEELEDIAKYILHHHERWDGKGYPEGISGSEIPIISQIITIADAWDAMTSDRSYRKALTYDTAISEILEGKGKQFSPSVVEGFTKCIKVISI